MSNLATQITNLLPKPVPSIHWTTVLESASDLTAKRLIQIRSQAPLSTRIAKTFAGGLRQMSAGRRGNPKQTTRISSIRLPTPNAVSRVGPPGSRHETGTEKGSSCYSCAQCRGEHWNIVEYSTLSLRRPQGDLKTLELQA